MAVSVGAAVPAAVFGKAVMGIVIAPGMLVALFALTRPEVRRAALRVVAGPAGLAFGLFALVSLVGVLTSQDVLKSLETWARTVAFALFAVTATQVLARDRQALEIAKRSLIATAAVSFLHVVFAVHVSDQILALTAWGKEIGDAVAVHFKGYGSAVACLLPVGLWALAGPELSKKALRLGFLVLAILSIWLDGTQASLAGALGLAVMVILIAAVAGLGRLAKNRRPAVVAGLTTVVVVGAVALTAALPAARDTDPSRLRIPTWMVDHHRQMIWAFTLEAAAERPLFGYGPNTINFVEGANQAIPDNPGVFLPSHPHNWIYEIASETGIFGLLTLCAGLLLLLRKIAVFALTGSPAGWAGVGVFGAFWGSSLVNFSIWAAWWQLTFCVLLTIVMAAAARAGGDPGRLLAR